MKDSKKGEGVAMVRAMMMLYPKEKRLYEDRYSEKLLPLLYRFFLNKMSNPKKLKSMMKKGEKSTPGVMGWFFCRDRYVDDIIKACLK